VSGSDSRGGVAILGGTFNPVHIGHLRSAVELLTYLPVDELRFVPCALPPHREPPGVTAARRADMVELAIAGEPGLACDRRELEREGPSYTIDTLLSLREELGGLCPLMLVLGSDALLGLVSWHRWRELLDHCHIVALARPGWMPPQAGELAAYLAERTAPLSELRARPAGGVHIAQLRPLAVSATEIRGLLHCHQSIRYLVPDAVHAYIHAHRLYNEREHDLPLATHTSENRADD
jgi:nicotinate-nucleotide adenylyltransferase